MKSNSRNCQITWWISQSIKVIIDQCSLALTVFYIITFKICGHEKWVKRSAPFNWKCSVQFSSFLQSLLPFSIRLRKMLHMNRRTHKHTYTPTQTQRETGEMTVGEICKADLPENRLYWIIPNYISMLLKSYASNYLKKQHSYHFVILFLFSTYISVCKAPL